MPSSLSSTSSSSSSSTILYPSSRSTSNFLRKLILKKHQPSSNMSPPPSQASSSFLSPSEFKHVRIVYRPAAPSLGPLSKPHSDWRAESSGQDEWRGRSGRTKTLRFDLPTPSTPVPIPTYSTVNASSSSSHVHPFDLPSAQHVPSFSPSSPSNTSHYHLSSHPIQVRVEPARSSSTSPSGSESGSSSAFYDEEDEEDFDSGASTSSAFSFIEGEELEGLDDVVVRRASEDSQSSEVGAFEHHLHFTRKPSLVSNQAQAFSLPDFDLSSLSYSNANGDDATLSRREQFKRRRVGAEGVGFWQSRSLASSL